MMSPLMMLLGSLFFFSTLAYQVLSSKALWLVLTLLFGIAASQIVIFPLVMVKTFSERNLSYLLLIPGLFYFWLLHLIALFWAAIGVLFKRKMKWEVTRKKRME
ncbi:MAG: hypothetical protein ACE5KV_08110 [Thermoplasmata archaeon]